MKRLLCSMMLLGTLGCQSGPVSAPLGSQLFLGVEAVSIQPGALATFDVLVLNQAGDTALNNILVEFIAAGAVLLPPEAIVGASNQPQVDEDGNVVPGSSAVSWCEAYVSDEDAYEDCFNEYFFEILALDAGISPSYARIPTNNRGIAQIYFLAFCSIINGVAVCADSTEDQEGQIAVNIGVDSAAFEITYSGVE